VYELRGLLLFSRCELLLLEAGNRLGTVLEQKKGKSAVGSRYQTTTGEDTAG
jgi:hypothetical protein